MKKIRKNKGFTLMELLVALPMIAVVFLSIAYMLASTGSFTSVEIAKVKTQTAANNLLMLIKANKFANLDSTLAGLNDSLTLVTTTNGEEITKTAKDGIPLSSIIHPDAAESSEGRTKLVATIVEKPAGGEAENIDSKICVITVEAPDFQGISTVIKTLSF